MANLDDLDDEARLAHLEEEVATPQVPVVALELHVGDLVAELRAVVAAPGWDDSRFQAGLLASFSSDETDAVARVRAVARSLAGRLGVELSTTPPEAPWIARQGPPPDADYLVFWTADLWTDAGQSRREHSAEKVSTSSGRRAFDLVEAALVQRLDGGARPLHLDLSILDLAVSERRALVPPLPAELPRAEDLLAPLATWAAGGSRPGELDHTLGPALTDSHGLITRPARLRAAAAAGASIVALVRAERAAGAGTIHLLHGLRNAFPPLDLATAKRALARADAAPDAAEDAAIDAELATWA